LRARVGLVVQGLERPRHARGERVLGGAVLAAGRTETAAHELVARLVVLVERTLVADGVRCLARLLVERLVLEGGVGQLEVATEHTGGELRDVLADRVLALRARGAGRDLARIVAPGVDRSEERRVGKEGRGRG